MCGIATVVQAGRFLGCFFQNYIHKRNQLETSIKKKFNMETFWLFPSKCLFSAYVAQNVALEQFIINLEVLPAKILKEAGSWPSVSELDIVQYVQSHLDLTHSLSARQVTHCCTR